MIGGTGLKDTNKRQAAVSILQLFLVMCLSFAALLPFVLSHKKDGYDSFVILFYVPAIIFIYTKDKSRFKLSMKKPSLSKQTAIGIGIFIGLYALNAYLKIGGFEWSLPPQVPTGLLVIYLLIACVASPIAEEIVFRYYLYSITKSGFGMPAGFAFSLLAFVLFHGSDSSLENIALQGAVYTYVFERTDSVKASILVHMFNNSLWYLTAYFRA